MRRWLDIRRAFGSEAASRKQTKAHLVRLSSSRAPDETSRRVIFSGIQPTGVPHLGNYLGALRPWVTLQNAKRLKDELNFSIVDLHALTVPQDPVQLKEWRLDTYVALLAVGLDTEKSRVFFQSAVRAHSELMWILSTLASTGYLSRMTQWKSRLDLPADATLQDSKAKAALKLGLLSYPVLQAADILLYKTTHVPVGEDQRQHIEFARTLAASFNHEYGKVFTIPETVISPARRIMSLTDPTKKMSKSDPNPNSRILIIDDEETIYQKFKIALTDSIEGISYDPETRPGVSNLLDILRFVRDEDKAGHDPAAEFKDSNLRILKATVAGAVVTRLRKVRERFLQLRSRPESLESALSMNQKQATSQADSTMLEVKEALGLSGFGQRLEASSYILQPVSK